MAWSGHVTLVELSSHPLETPVSRWKPSQCILKGIQAINKCVPSLAWVYLMIRVLAWPLLTAIAVLRLPLRRNRLARHLEHEVFTHTS